MHTDSFISSPTPLKDVKEVLKHFKDVIDFSDLEINHEQYSAEDKNLLS